MLRMLGVVAAAIFLIASNLAAHDAPLTPASSLAIADQAIDAVMSQITVVRPTRQRYPSGPVGEVSLPGSRFEVLFAQEACDSSSSTGFSLHSASDQTALSSSPR